MTRPPVPAEEAARLEVVHSLGRLDTPQEERFDRIARTASRMSSVPIAFVSLLDADRQWNKTCLGPLTKQYERADSVCATTILVDAPLVVRDLVADPRFTHLSVVAGEPHVRFYAGVPLRVQGRAVGTLCILDVQPRDLDDGDVAALEDLASWAEDELGEVELAAARQHEREAEAQPRRLRERHELVLAAAQTGVLGTTPDGCLELANPAACGLLGVRDPRGLSLHDALHRSPHHVAEDCDLLAVVEGGMSYRGNQDGLVHEDDSRSDVEYTIAPVLEDGRTTGAVVTLNDITERRVVERMKDEFVSVVMVLPAPTAGATPDVYPDVVLVEDDADLVELLSTALTAAGLRVASADTEDEAVALVLRTRPRLLLDVELVSGSGFGVAARLRAAPSTARTAAVVATVYDLDETARRRLTIGPTRFVRKGRGEDDVVQALVDAAGVLPGSSA